MNIKMKKIFICVIGIIFSLSIISVFVVNSDYFKRHFAGLPKITGKIVVKVNGEQFQAQDILTLTYINDEGSKDIPLNGGDFSILFGQYGKNQFAVKLKNDFCIKYFNINIEKIVKYSYITSNNWHKEYLFITFMQKDDTVLLNFNIFGDESGEGFRIINLDDFLLEDNTEITVNMMI